MQSVGERFRPRLVVGWVLALLPIGIFYALLTRFFIPLPVEDDYDAVLAFGMVWTRASARERWLLFLSNQHNEYKPFLQNAFLAVQLAWLHHISLAVWIWTGNLLVLVCLVPLWLNCAPGKQFTTRLLLFLPVIWVFLSLNYSETLNFALSGMQEIPVVLFGLWAIHFATRRDVVENRLSCVSSFMACAAYANAFLLAPIGFIFFRGRQKRGVLVAWCLSFALVLVPFLYRYQPLPHQRGTVRQYLEFFVTLAGAGIAYRRLPVLGPFALGLVVLACFAYAAVRRFDRKNPFAFWSSAWMIGCFALAAFGRAGGGASLALAPRYRIYSDLVLVALYLLTLSVVQANPVFVPYRRKLYLAALCCSIAFGLISDQVGYAYLKNRRKDLIYGVQRFVETNGQASPLDYPDVPNTAERRLVHAKARGILTEALRSGLYQLPAHD